MAKKIKLLKDEKLQNGIYIRAWKERRDFVVQVWISGNPIGEPDGYWVMPGILGLETCVAQAVLQTRKE